MKGCLKRPVHTCIQLESEDPSSCATFLAWSRDDALASDASTVSSAVRISFRASKTVLGLHEGAGTGGGVSAEDEAVDPGQGLGLGHGGHLLMQSRQASRGVPWHLYPTPCILSHVLSASHSQSRAVGFA
jgi:hypothetical protein